MANETINAYRTRIIQLVAGFVLFVPMVFSIHGMMFGGHGMASLTAILMVGAGVVLALDKYYWVLLFLIPAAGLRLPSLPFSPGELGALVLVVVYFVRTAFHRDDFRPVSSAPVVAALPYFLWAMFIFLLNPVGLSIFGSTMIGGRHYFDLVLGLVVLIVLSRIEFSEAALRWVFAGLILCAFLRVGIDYYYYRAGFDFDPENAGTRYYLIPFGTILMLLVARTDLSRIVSRPWLVFVCAVFMGLVVLSGKRTVVGSVFLMPFVMMYLRRREYLLTLLLAFFGAVLLGVAISGQGVFYELPRSVQRGLSFLPGRWERRYETMGFQDQFRDELHRRARQIIHENPWIGRGGFAMDYREIAWLITDSGARDTMFGGHELAGNWHNKFWGMWADFGVVAPFAWYGFVLFALAWSFRRRNDYLDDSYSSTFYRYWFYSLFLDLVLAYGHSSMTPFSRWQTFGLLLALNNMRKRQLEESAVGLRLPSVVPESPVPAGAVS